MRIYQPQTGELISTCQFANEHLNAEASKKFKAGNHTHINDGVFVQTVKEQDGVIYCSEPVGSSQH